MKRPVLVFAAILAVSAAVARAEDTPPVAAAPAAAAPDVVAQGVRTYAIDGKKSVLAVQVFKAGAAAALAHDHVIHATAMSGSITVDAANPSLAKVEVTVPTKSLVNDDPKVRKQYGVVTDISDDDKATVLEHMQAEGQLDIAKFPTITFVSTSATGSGNKLTLNGRLTLHGVTKDISLPIEATIKGNTIDGKGSVKLNTSDFGIQPYSAFFGAVKNKDGIVLHVHLVANAS